MAGVVLVDGAPADKPGKPVSLQAHVTVKERLPYVGRGGLKLEGALDGFGIDPSGLTILDAGASTGGFTDCLLQRGAARVIAVDVGYGQLHWKLRQDPRVTVFDRENIRTFDPKRLPYAVHAITADLSFISLKLVLGKFYEILPSNGWAVTLIKPQFEVGRKDVAKGGIVRDEAAAEAAMDSVKSRAEEVGFSVMGEMESPIKGAKGNREYFLRLVKR